MRRFLLTSGLLFVLSTTGCELGAEVDDLGEEADDPGEETDDLGDEADDPGEEADPLESASELPLIVAGTSGKLNLWDDTGYRDTHQSRYSYDSDFRNDGFNDKASSVINRTGDYWLLFSDRSYQGFGLCVRPYSAIRDLEEIKFQYQGYYYNWNDRTSSVKRKTSAQSSCGNHRVAGTRY